MSGSAGLRHGKSGSPAGEGLSLLKRQGSKQTISSLRPRTNSNQGKVDTVRQSRRWVLSAAEAKEGRQHLPRWAGGIMEGASKEWSGEEHSRQQKQYAYRNRGEHMVYLFGRLLFIHSPFLCKSCARHHASK